jgi:hypothetical protein
MTLVRRHVAPGKAVPLHPQAAAFAEHYGFAIDVLAAHRPTGKGRVERQAAIARDHVLAGRTFASAAPTSPNRTRLPARQDACAGDCAGDPPPLPDPSSARITRAIASSLSAAAAPPHVKEARSPPRRPARSATILT